MLVKRSKKKKKGKKKTLRRGRDRRDRLITRYGGEYRYLLVFGSKTLNSSVLHQIEVSTSISMLDFDH
jgi:hypothetical protein